MAWGDKGGFDGGGPWGRPTGGGQQSPGGDMPPGGPDFDEWVRRSQEKIHQMFPGGGDSKKGFALIIAVILVLWMASGIYFVKADEQGVVLRFGAYNRTTGAGVNYHLPYPIESVATPRVTVINRLEVGARSGVSRKNGETSIAEESLMLTGDENIIDVNFEVQWKISDAPNFLFNIRAPEETVRAVAESAMREVIGTAKIATVLAEGKLNVEQNAKKLMQDTLEHYKAGIEVVRVNLLKADPPSQVIDAFRDVQTARADLETSRNQAESYRNDIIPKARGQAQQMVLEAEAYKQEVIARAQGEASRFSAVYNEYKQAKDVTKKRMYLETMESILQGMNKIVLEGKNSQGVLPYLPLPELKAKAAQGDKQ
ncbi:MAG: FtsH protease activity modulator HflK [Alphaproteobacteria bacterium]